MAVKVVQAALSESKRLAFFCPVCGQLVDIDSLAESPKMNASTKFLDWRAMLTGCEGTPDETPYIVIWREE